MNEYDKSWCQKLLTEINKMPISEPFRRPVDPVRDGAPDYFEKVKHPMDFETMKKKLANEEYITVQNFIDDINLICDNAILYNKADSIYGLICNDIAAEVQKFFYEKSDSLHQEWMKSLNKAVNELKEHMKHIPADSSLIYKGISMPDISSINQDQEKKIESEIGDNISTLKERWIFLNEETQKKIEKIVE